MKKFTVQFIVLSLLLTCFSVTGYTEAERVNLMEKATVTSNSAGKPGEGVGAIKDTNRRNSFTTDEKVKAEFPYWFDIDFGIYNVELCDLDFYSILGLEMGITNIDIMMYEGERIVPIKNDNNIKWELRNNFTDPELRTFHFSNRPTSNKFRIVVNTANLEWGNFRIDEIELFGRIVGIFDEVELMELEPQYQLVTLNSKASLEKNIELAVYEGKAHSVSIDWANISTAQEGLYSVSGRITHFNQEAKAIIDIYDPLKEEAALAGEWCERTIRSATGQGLLGGISNDPKYQLNLGDISKILFRDMKLIPAANNSLGFPDNVGGIYAASLECGYFEGIVKNNFEPEKPVSRMEALKILKNMGKLDTDSADAANFGDIATLSGDEINIINAAFTKGIITAADWFEPGRIVTTAEFLTMLQRSMGGNSEMLTVNFEDNDMVVANPHMGLFSYHVDNNIFMYDDLYDYDEHLELVEGLGNVYNRIPWCVLEPEEDKYDFSIIDTTIQRQMKMGRQFSFRITTMESEGSATPKWVFDNGAKGQLITGGGWYNASWFKDGMMAPLYDDPVYLQHLDDLLSELARRYDGHEAIAYIDLGFGIWGEGHVGQYGGIMTPEIIFQQMELYKKNFPNTQLIMTDDAGYNWDNNFFDEYKQKMIDLKIGYRDDSFFGIKANMKWRLPEEYLETEGIWQQSPVIMEPEHYWRLLQGNNWGNGMDLAEMLDEHHATYFGLHGPSKAMYAENPELMAYINKRLGYRIIPSEVSVSSRSVGHGEILMGAEWKNVGAAPCYNGAYPALTLKDKNGNIVTAMVDGRFNISDLPVAEYGNAQTIRQDSVFKLNNLVYPGEYEAYLSLGSLDGTPKIRMPIDAPEDGEKRYHVGGITITGEYKVSVVDYDEAGNIVVAFEVNENMRDYYGYGFEIAYYEVDAERLYPRGDMHHSWHKESVVEALARKENCEWDLDLTMIPNIYHERTISDNSILKNRTYDVYLFHSGFMKDVNVYGFMLPEQGRQAFIGRIYIDDDLKTHYTPPEQ